MIVLYLCIFFFFKQKTAYEMRISDWSSDVCSSDLHRRGGRSVPRNSHRPHCARGCTRSEDFQTGRVSPPPLLRALPASRRATSLPHRNRARSEEHTSESHP